MNRCCKCGKKGFAVDFSFKIKYDTDTCYCEECKEEEIADNFFELMHKSSRAGLHKEIEKMYNEIKDLKIKVTELEEDKLNLIQDNAGAGI